MNTNQQTAREDGYPHFLRLEVKPTNGGYTSDLQMRCCPAIVAITAARRIIIAVSETAPDAGVRAKAILALEQLDAVFPSCEIEPIH